MPACWVHAAASTSACDIKDHDHGHQMVEGTAGYHPHESPWTILVPLGLLSLGAIFSGFAIGLTLWGFATDPAPSLVNDRNHPIADGPPRPRRAGHCRPIAKSIP